MIELIVSLADMLAGQSGIVVETQGGHGMVARLNAMGIRPGVAITKKSTQLMRGPVVVQAGRSEFALGFGVARRVMVDVEP